MTKVITTNLISHFDLELISGESGIDRLISTADLNRPGIELAGYFEYYPEERIQIIGQTELSFFKKLPKDEQIERIAKLCTEKTPCIVITRGNQAPDELIEASKETGVPILRTKMITTKFQSRLTNFLESKLAPVTSIHAELVDVSGVGVIITGKSGVGKSEAALELVKRGHRLVADDCVDIRLHEGELIGQAPDIIENLIEIRGLGILNVMTMFGAGAVKKSDYISLIIDLEEWDQNKNYDRLGLDEDYTKIFDIEVPKLTVPVRPGRNVAVIIEVAAMNHRLKSMGIHSAKEFTDKLTDFMNHKPE